MLNSYEHEILKAHKYKNIKNFIFLQAQLSLECYFSCSQMFTNVKMPVDLNMKFLITLRPCSIEVCEYTFTFFCHFYKKELTSVTSCLFPLTKKPFHAAIYSKKKESTAWRNNALRADPPPPPHPLEKGRHENCFIVSPESVSIHLYHSPL